MKKGGTVFRHHIVNSSSWRPSPHPVPFMPAAAIIIILAWWPSREKDWMKVWQHPNQPELPHSTACLVWTLLTTLPADQGLAALAHRLVDSPRGETCCRLWTPSVTFPTALPTVTRHSRSCRTVPPPPPSPVHSAAQSRTPSTLIASYRVCLCLHKPPGQLPSVL